MTTGTGRTQLTFDQVETPAVYAAQVSTVSRNAVSQQKSQKKRYVCNLCGEHGHFMYKCPMLEEAKSAAESCTWSLQTVVKTVNQPQCRNILLLDTGASDNIVRDADLLTDIREVEQEVSINGIGGTITTKIVGRIHPFGDAYYHPAAAANIISFSTVTKNSRITYDSNMKRFHVDTETGECVTFAEQPSGLYAAYIAKSLVANVEENGKGYSKAEVKAARSARELLRKMGFPSERELSEMIRNGAIVDSPVTVHDVARAHAIYGQDVASLKGKTTGGRPTKVKIEYLPPPEVAIQTLDADIMYVGGEPYLVSVSSPLCLTMVNHLNTGKTATQLSRALKEQINSYRARNFVIDTIQTDGEGALAAAAMDLQAMGIKTNPSGAGKHIPKVERKIRTIKERVRTHLASLPYNLPASWLPS